MNRLPPKKDVALALLESSTLFMHLDPRVEQVRVPPWFKRQPQLVLQIGLNMPVPIPDLNLDEGGVSCTLSFNRSPFYCHVPWKAIYALVGEDGRGMVWPEDIPPEVAAQAQARAQGSGAATQRGHLRAVPTSAAAPSEPPKRETPLATSMTEAASPTEKKKRSRRKAARTGEQPGGAKPRQSRTARPALASVDSSKSSSPRAASESAGAKKKRDLPPYLRIVK